MIRRVHILAALAALLVTAPAATQTPFTGLVFPPQSVLGNTSSQSNFGQAIPFATLTGGMFPRSLQDIGSMISRCYARKLMLRKIGHGFWTNWRVGTIGLDSS
jgi:hypothetical protein